jgi:hypothetical protein
VQLLSIALLWKVESSATPITNVTRVNVVRFSLLVVEVCVVEPAMFVVELSFSHIK